MKNNIYTCSECHHQYTGKLTDACMIACTRCAAIIFYKGEETERPAPAKVPEDWSFIQLGTTGEIEDKPFTVIGRIRLQLRNDYKNFWCSEFENGRSLWLVESFASIALCPAGWQPYNGPVKKLRASVSIRMNNDWKVRGEYVEKCEGLSYEGEVSEWQNFEPHFFFVQGSSADHRTALFTIRPKRDTFVLTGQKVELERLNLKNIRIWNEWQ